MNGITLIAIGSHVYGGAAYNLTLSCKKYCPDIPIQLIYEKSAVSHLSKDMLCRFDYLTEIKHEHAYEGSVLMPCKAKIYINEYLIFDKTLFLDADSICLKDFKDLFNDEFEFKAKINSTQSVYIDKHKDFHWMHPKDLREHYHLKEEPLYGISTAFMLIKKGVKGLFEAAQDAYLNRPRITKLREQWGRSFPDELFFAVALAKSEINPQTKPVVYTLPTYEPIIFDNFYFLSLLGTNIRRGIGDIYTRESNKACVHFGSKNYFPIDKLIKHKWLNQ